MNDLIKMGYSQEAIESTFTRLWKDGMNIQDMKSIRSMVKEELDSHCGKHEERQEVTEETTIMDDGDVKGEETQDARKDDMLHRLQCTAAIPSPTDVINGFRQWYSVTSDDVISYLPVNQ